MEIGGNRRSIYKRWVGNVSPCEREQRECAFGKSVGVLGGVTPSPGRQVHERICFTSLLLLVSTFSQVDRVFLICWQALAGSTTAFNHLSKRWRRHPNQHSRVPSPSIRSMASIIYQVCIWCAGSGTSGVMTFGAEYSLHRHHGHHHVGHQRGEFYLAARPMSGMW